MPAQVASILTRLSVGLVGSAVITAALPFLPLAKETLLVAVALLGTLGAVALSTSYQLVQNFRHADIIALGIGGVGSGPILMVLQVR